VSTKICQILIVSIALCIVSCQKAPVEPHFQIPEQDSITLFVACEGSYGNGNASLYAVDESQNVVYGQLFKNANGEPLGDVLQWITVMGEKLFLCVNNSDKIEVVNRYTFKRLATIPVEKPRSLLIINEHRALVGSLFHNKIYELDLDNCVVKKTLELSAKNAEQFLKVGHEIFVANWDDHCRQLYVLDSEDLSLKDSIRLPGFAPQCLVTDAQNNLWALAGNQTEGRRPTLSKIDPVSHQILDTFLFDTDFNAMRLVTDPSGQFLYFLGVNYSGQSAFNGVYKMNIDDEMLPALPWLKSGDFEYFWALGVQPHTGDVYLGLPKGFVQKGAVRVYSSTAILQNEFQVGVGPGMFYFVD